MSQHDHGGTDERTADDKVRTRALSGDDFEEVMSEERKDDKTSQQQQAEAAAAGPSSPSAAAASVSSSSSSSASSASSATAPPSHPRDEMEDVVCSACHESFECADESARLPRTLPCGHPMCSGCIRQSLNLTPGSVLCPHEHGQSKISVPAGVAAAAVSTTEGWLRLLPPRADLIAAIKNQQTLMTQLVQKGAECTHQGCKEPVTHFCADCGELCATHERKRHALALFASHKLTTIPIAEKAAAFQCKSAGPAGQFRAQADARLMHQQQQTQAAQDDLRRFEAEVQEQLRQKRQDVEVKEQILGQVKRTADQMRAANDSAVLELEADRLEAEGQAELRAYRALGSTVLNTLSDQRVADLQTFLGPNRLLSKATLIYRASRDGFKADDWWRQCGGKASLLTIVKVSSNGFVLGAFAPFQWPVIPVKNADIADLTGATFLFSLVNAQGRAVKFRLQQSQKAKAGAVSLDCGPILGYRELGLMGGGKSADEDCANYFWPSLSVFEFDCVADGGKPIAYNKTLLAGDDGKKESKVHFAAAKIETWQL